MSGNERLSTMTQSARHERPRWLWAASCLVALLLAAYVTIKLWEFSQRYSLRNPPISMVDPPLGPGHFLWIATAAGLLLTALTAGALQRGTVPGAVLASLAGILLVAPMPVAFAGAEFTALWLALGTALCGFYLACCRFSAELKPQGWPGAMPWALPAAGFAAVVVWTIWAILFLE